MEARPIHFLLVEDDDGHAKIVDMALRDYRVINTMDRVRDGEEAMMYVRREGSYVSARRPDVILLDLKLPKLDGHEVLAALKADRDLGKIPVVMLTTSGAEVDRERAYAAHVNSYLTKPLEFTQFVEMVRDLNLYWAVWNTPPPGGST